MIKLKLLFENTTKYNKFIYNKYLEFHNKKYRFTYVCYTAFVVAFILFGLILQVQYHNYSIAIFLCCILTFFVLWRIFKPVSEIVTEYKSDKIQNEKVFTFKFYDKCFMIKDNNILYEVKYFQLYRVFEVSDFFYLYIDKKHAFLLDKSKFKNDNVTEFSSFIKKKCWWNFKKVK